MWFDFAPQIKRAGQFKNFKYYSTFLFSANYVFSNGLKNVRNVIQMTLKWLFFGALPPDHNTLELHQFVQHAAQLQHFFEQDYFNFWFKPLSKIVVSAVRF